MSNFGTVPFRPQQWNGVSTRSLGKPPAVFPGGVATDSDMAVAVDLQQTQLALPMTASDTAMTVVNPSSIVPYNLLSINAEIVKVTGPPVGNVVPVSRAFDGTTATVHVTGALVSGFVDAYHHNRVVAEIEAIEGALGANLSHIPGSAFVVASAFIFSPQSPGGTLTPGTNAILLSPVPAGVNGTDANHYLYISGGTGAAEAVPITGGGAVSGAASGTIFVTCANAHSGAWTIATATSGGQEALYSSTGPLLVYYPAGNWPMYARLFYPRDGISVSGFGLAVTKLTWQVNLAGDLIYVAGIGGTSPTTRWGAELRNLAIYSTVTQTAGAAFHAFACRNPVIFNVNFQGSDPPATPTLYHGIWFDQLDYGYVDRGKVVAAQDGIRVNGGAGTGAAKAGLYISATLIGGPAAVGIHVGGAFGGLALTETDILGNGTGILIDKTLAAENNREIFLDALVSIDSSTTTGIDIVSGLDNGYLGLSGTWVATNGTGIRIRSTAGSAPSINMNGGTIFNHSVVGILNECDTTASITLNGTVFRANALAINQSVSEAYAELNFITNGVRFDNNTANVSGQLNITNMTLVNGGNNDVSHWNARVLNITGPTAPFSITGVVAGCMGDALYVSNATGQVMSLAENSTSSAVGNRIITGQGTVTIRAMAILVYVQSWWYLAGYN